MLKIVFILFNKKPFSMIQGSKIILSTKSCHQNKNTVGKIK
jgi:hypothetical protein